MPTPQSFKDMPLWQRSVQLAIDISQLSLALPDAPRLVVVTNLQEAAIDIPTVLARGSKAGKPGFMNALASARQTVAELQTLLIIAQNVYDEPLLAALHDKALELESALRTMSQRLSADHPSQVG